MLTKLEELIEEAYGLSISEFPSENFRDMGIYAEALKRGYSNRNWLKYRAKRDKQGFTMGDDLFLILMLMCEKAFNITIKDEEAEKINTIEELKMYVECYQHS